MAEKGEKGEKANKRGGKPAPSRAVIKQRDIKANKTQPPKRRTSIPLSHPLTRGGREPYIGERRSRAAKKGASRMTAEERRERALKGWETRNRNRWQREIDEGQRHLKKSLAGKKGAEANNRRRNPQPAPGIWRGVWRGDDPRWEQFPPKIPR